VLNWSKQFDTFCFLDNQQYNLSPHSEECLAGAGVADRTATNETLYGLQHFIDKHDGQWLFGHLSYDLKNSIEDLNSAHADNLSYPDLFFFQPKVVVQLNSQQMIITATEPDLVFNQINSSADEMGNPALRTNVRIQQRISNAEYVAMVNQLKQHILRGDCYEINFCQEFYASHVQLDPYGLHERLSRLSPNPFSALYRLDDKWLICASPERFLRKQGNTLISQPIKGTSRRMPESELADNLKRKELFESEKDRSENVMIVDLVRNDLSRICEEGSVKVDELFGIYSFPQVHQMISTISGRLKAGTEFTDIIRSTFPMGSMTGAPKKRAMELIEEYEQTRRGIFSGSVGYISPNGDFDFNVVIRSIMYNQEKAYLSFQTGSAITFYSDPQTEWEECLLKAKAMQRCFDESSDYSGSTNDR
jgi:para-aminobenzoate synthetase component 1